jgi:hypothetical protein
MTSSRDLLTPVAIGFDPTLFSSFVRDPRAPTVTPRPRADISRAYLTPGSSSQSRSDLNSSDRSGGSGQGGSHSTGPSMGNNQANYGTPFTTDTSSSPPSGLDPALTSSPSSEKSAGHMDIDQVEPIPWLPITQLKVNQAKKQEIDSLEKAIRSLDDWRENVVIPEVTTALTLIHNVKPLIESLLNPTFQYPYDVHSDWDEQIKSDTARDIDDAVQRLSHVLTSNPTINKGSMDDC